MTLKIVTRLLAAVGVALSLGACGSDSGSSSGSPPAPTTPTPPPAPPEPPSNPFGIRVTDRGEDFVEWSWDRVEGATGYEADVFVTGTLVDERTRVETEEPSYRWGSLIPSTSVGIFVRAVSETAGGRAESEWSEGANAVTLSPSTPLAACSNERQLALDWEQTAILVSAWDPGRPFRVWIDEESIRGGGLQLDRPGFLEEEVLEPLRDVADRIEERLGYAIFDPYDLLSSRPSAGEPVIKVLTRDGEPLDPPWDPDCAPATASPMNALPWTAEIFFNRYFFDPKIDTCRGFVEDRTDETVVHELWHLFATKHSQSVDDWNSRLRNGLFMSDPLTSHREYDDSRVFLLQEDIDAIGCVFPHPDHPR